MTHPAEDSDRSGDPIPGPCRVGVEVGGVGGFTVTGIQVSSTVLTCLRWYPSQPGVVHRLSAIRSKIVSRGITRMCAVTVFTNMYWRWANRAENLLLGSVGLLWIIHGAARGGAE